jgi:hypothetical protein
MYKTSVVRDPEELGHITKSTRRTLARLGVARGRLPSLHNRSRLWRRLRQPQAGELKVRWLDNFNRHRWQRSFYLAAGNEGLDATVSAVLVVRRPDVPFPGHPSLDGMISDAVAWIPLL